MNNGDGHEELLDEDFGGLLNIHHENRQADRREGRDLLSAGTRLALADLERVRRERQEAEETVEIVADGLRVLRTRDGVPLTEDQILERARNIAAGLTGLPLAGVRFGARKALEEIDFAAAKEIG